MKQEGGFSTPVPRAGHSHTICKSNEAQYMELPPEGSTDPQALKELLGERVFRNFLCLQRVPFCWILYLIFPAFGLKSRLWPKSSWAALSRLSNCSETEEPLTQALSTKVSSQQWQLIICPPNIRPVRRFGPAVPAHREASSWQSSTFGGPPTHSSSSDLLRALRPLALRLLRSIWKTSPMVQVGLFRYIPGLDMVYTKGVYRPIPIFSLLV
jgi:hypothetical protein